MHTLLERSYSTQTTIKRTNFPRRFDKPNLNFHKVYTHSQSSGHIRIQSEIINHIRTALSFIFKHQETCQIQKNSQTAKSHLISPFFSLNLFCQLANARTAKKLPRQLPRLPEGIRTYPLSKPIFLNQRSAVKNDVNFQQKLQREAF